MKLFKKFLDELSRTSDPLFFFAILKILRIKIRPLEKDGVPNISEYFEEVFEKFISAPRHRQKEIISMLQEANKYANSAENQNADSNGK